MNISARGRWWWWWWWWLRARGRRRRRRRLLQRFRTSSHLLLQPLLLLPLPLILARPPLHRLGLPLEVCKPLLVVVVIRLRLKVQSLRVRPYRAFGAGSSLRATGRGWAAVLLLAFRVRLAQPPFKRSTVIERREFRRESLRMPFDRVAVPFRSAIVRVLASGQNVHSHSSALDIGRPSHTACCTRHT